MMLRFTRLELQSWRRDTRLWLVLIATMLALTGAASWATASDIARQGARWAATKQARADWEGVGAANPHYMAHFGDFVFRPVGSLARLDRGVQMRLGKVLRIEGHRQGTPLRSDAHQAGTLARFPRPDPAFLLQTIVPLLLIFLGGTGLAEDREVGRLKLSLVQGARAREILGGRLLALWGLGLTLLASVVVASLVTSAVLAEPEALSVPRLTGFIAVHALFFAVVAAGVVTATVWLLEARSSLFVLLGLWVVATTVLPRATAGLAGALYPLPSQDAFQAQLRAAREAGPDGHDAQDKTLKRLLNEVLDAHCVEGAEDLPLNFDGLRMQEDEKFGNRVWDEHYGGLQLQMGRQSAIATWVALVNPVQAIDHLSTAMAATDLAHDFAFQQQAEAYRRSLVEALNHEHAYGGSKTGEWSWKASATFLASLEPFGYVPPEARAELRRRLPELLALVVWGVVLLIALLRGADHLERGKLPC